MELIILFKITLLSLIYSLVVTAIYNARAEPVNIKSISIAFAPWIALFLYFMLFWWG